MQSNFEQYKSMWLQVGLGYPSMPKAGFIVIANIFSWGTKRITMSKVCIGHCFVGLHTNLKKKEERKEKGEKVNDPMTC